MAVPLCVRKCFNIFRWLPVIFISAIILWSYYAYVIKLVISSMNNLYERIFLSIIYHIIYFLFVWSYYQAIFTNPGKPPKKFFLPKETAERVKNEENGDIQRDILNRFAENLPVQCRTILGSVRYCETCACIKPDRSHHCSVCNQCVLKMDHHCPWINNCACFTNYKFFILFLFYTQLYCLYVGMSSLKYFISFWTDSPHLDGSSKFHILFLFFAAAMFFISVTSLLSYHIYLTLYNRSTLESFRAPHFASGSDKNAYNLSKSLNFRQVFGNRKLFWILPITTSIGNGVVFTTRYDNEGYGILNSNQSWMEEGHYASETQCLKNSIDDED